MELIRYLRLLRRWWWLGLLGVALGSGAAYFVSQLKTPVYQTSATLLVNQTQTPGTIAYNDILTSERLTRTYGQLITKRPVLEEVLDRLLLPLTADELAGRLEVDIVRDTQLLRLSARSTDPAEAQRLANGTARAFIALNESSDLSRPGSVSIVEQGTRPGAPVEPRTRLNTALGAFAGLIVAGAIALVYEYLDDTLKTPEDVEAAAALPTLGGVARFPHSRSPSRSLVVASTRRTASAEAYKVVRTNVDFSTLDRPAQVLMITSANPGEGKTTTAANLALAIAQTGKRVVLVDADLRRPALHRVFALDNRTGLTSALLSRDGNAGLFLQRTDYDHLSVLSSGPLPPNPSELLSSRRLTTVLDAVRKEADVVVVDSPPVLAVADATILASKVDAVVLVVDAGRTRAQALQRAHEALGRSKTRVLGAILNKLTERGRGYYYYTYHYYGADDDKRSGRRRRFPWNRKSRERSESPSYA